MNTQNLVVCFLLTASIGRAFPTGTPPKFDEVYQLLRSNLQGVSQTDLDRAAVKGLLEQLPGQATLVEGQSNNADASGALAALSKVAVYDNSYAYFRIGAVKSGLDGKLRAAYQDLIQTNKAKIKGVILDLRFASGSDYGAAAAAADCFLDSEQHLLEWGTSSASATKKTNAIAVPVAILVNAQTSGAAEALAAALREADTGLILGGTTAGQANTFKEFTLGNGEKLRIANAQVKLGDGSVLAHGLKPDIAVDESLADERAYLDDPYKILHLAEPVKNSSTTKSSLASTNQSTHRPTNEAELVRERRAGETDDGSSELDNEPAAPDVPEQPVIADSALARALDLLKGLAVLQQSHPG